MLKRAFAIVESLFVGTLVCVKSSAAFQVDLSRFKRKLLGLVGLFVAVFNVDLCIFVFGRAHLLVES